MTEGALTEMESAMVTLGERLLHAEQWRTSAESPELDRLADLVIGRLLERVYPTPGTAMHEREQSWLSHEDIATMPAPELANERARLRLRLMIDERPDFWFLERLQRIEARQGQERTGARRA
jgi:hypothetical protein